MNIKWLNVKNSKIYQEGGIWKSDNPFVNRVIQIESGGNPLAVAGYPKGTSNMIIRNSRAAGLFQFIPSTGKMYGLKLEERFNPEKSFEAFKLLVRDNISALAKHNIPITATNLYLAHQQGAGGLKAIWNNINLGTPIGMAIRMNMNNNRRPEVPKDASAKDWYNAWDKFIGV